MRQRLIQIIGLAVSAVYAVVIVWIYATEPRSFKEVATGAEVATGTYQVDQTVEIIGCEYKAGEYEMAFGESEKIEVFN